MYVTRSVFPGFLVQHQRNEAGEPLKSNLHTHSNAELYYFICGKATYHIEGSVYKLSPGDILLMRSSEVHYIDQDPDYPYERIYVHFDPEILTQMHPDTGLLRPFLQRRVGTENLYPASEQPEDSCRGYLEAMLAAGGDQLTAFANMILLLRTMETLFDSRKQDNTLPETLEYRIVRYINKNFHRDISVEELCEKFFISRAQLCRRFKQTTGTTVGKYIATKRLIAAQALIRQGIKPTEAYYQCGYQDYSTFYRAYVQLFGHSPKEAGQVEEADEDQLEII